ncbi:MAG TPA: hypothetical protein VGI73_05940 [Solirubrobacterales bacterium]|jgi:hypothetical protein
MMHKLKALGLALILVGALGAVAAGPALAEYHIASVSGGFITGSPVSTNQFVTDVGTASCSSVTFSGTQAVETASTLTVHPSYSGCSLAGLKITVSTTGCSLRFEKPETEPAPVHAALKVLCSAGSSIAIHDSAGVGCSISIGEQGPLSKVSFANNAGPSPPAGTVTFTAALTGITYTYSGGCPSAGGVGATHSNGAYSGQLLAVATAAFTVT